MTSIDNLASEVMSELNEYAELADTAMKKAVRKTATSVRKEISANAPKRTGRYRKSWTTRKTKESSHSLEMTVHSKDRYQIAHLLEHGHAKRGYRSGGGTRRGTAHKPHQEGVVMTYEEINEMMQEVGLPFAYHHFAEGESPDPPFTLFLSPGENTFGADNLMYFSFKTLHIELYTDEKSPESEERVEEVLTQHNIYYTKTETWIESEKLYEVLYQMEV